jgi:hypothetical protein
MTSQPTTPASNIHSPAAGFMRSKLKSTAELLAEMNATLPTNMQINVTAPNINSDDDNAFIDDEVRNVVKTKRYGFGIFMSILYCI